MLQSLDLPAHLLCGCAERGDARLAVALERGVLHVHLVPDPLLDGHCALGVGERLREVEGRGGERGDEECQRVCVGGVFVFVFVGGGRGGGRRGAGVVEWRRGGGWRDGWRWGRGGFVDGGQEERRLQRRSVCARRRCRRRGQRERDLGRRPALRRSGSVPVPGPGLVVPDLRGGL